MQFGKQRSSKKGKTLAFLNAPKHPNGDKNKKETRTELGQNAVISRSYLGHSDKITRTNLNKNLPKNDKLGQNAVINADKKNSKLGQNAVISRSYLGQNKRLIELKISEFNFVNHLCLLAESTGNRAEIRLVSRETTKALSISSRTERRLIKSLITYNKLSLLSAVDGRNGYRIISINEETWNEWKSTRTRTELGQNAVISRTENGAKLGHKLGQNVSSSSSNIYLNKTTTEEDVWDKIDISSLEDIGITETHIFQIKSSNKSTPEITKRSIEYFCYMLEKKTQNIRDPLAFFMKAMRNEGAIPKPLGYKSKIDKNLERLQKEKEEENVKLRGFVNDNFDMLLTTPKVIEEKENLMKSNLPGFYTEDSRAFKETMKAIIIEKIRKGELSLKGITNG